MTTANLGPYRAAADLRRDLSVMCRVLGVTQQEYVIASVVARLEVDREIFRVPFETLRDLPDREEAAEAQAGK